MNMEIGDISGILNALKTSYNEVVTGLTTETKGKVVDVASTKWACQDAVEFFKNAFKPAVDGLLDKTNSAFSSAANAFIGAEKTLYQMMQETNVPYRQFDVQKHDLDVTNIQTSVNGKKVFIQTEVESAISAIKAIQTKIDASLGSAVNTINSQMDENMKYNGGEAGKQMIEALRTTISSILAEIQNKAEVAKNATIEDYTKAMASASKEFTEASSVIKQ